MFSQLARVTRLAVALAILGALAFGARTAMAEAASGGRAPCTPLPLNGLCSAGTAACNDSCNLIGDPYAGGTCWTVEGSYCCVCQL